VKHLYITNIHHILAIKADGERTVVLKAMGKAINKTVTIAEILKRKLPLHQTTALSSCEMIDVFEPLEEGLDVVTNHRHVSCIKVTLSLEPMDVNHVGYQPPLPLQELQPGDAALEGNSRSSRGDGIAT
jgi:DNA-binding protein